MSDSDDHLPNNLFSFQNETMSTWGPNINSSNLTGISLRNNVLSSSMQAPRSFNQRRYAGSNYDQRSMYERETSLRSTMSACDIMQREFSNSYYPRGLSSQRSAFNGRSGSPVSVARSIDTTTSASAADSIAMMLKSMDFKTSEWKKIAHAFNKYKKNKTRHKVEKKWNMRHRQRSLLLRRSRGESGEEASDSSISSDDMSTRTSNYKGSMSIRSVKTDISDLRKHIRVSDVSRDCTDNLRHKSFQSIADVSVNLNNTRPSIRSQRSMMAGPIMPPFRSMPRSDYFNNKQKQPTAPISVQKERFLRSGYLLPSQRFKQSVASKTIPENAEGENHLERNNLQYEQDSAFNRNGNIMRNIETDSDQDEVFPGRKTHQRALNVQRETRVDSDDDICLSNQKRTKIASPFKTQNSKEARQPMPKETAKNTYKNGKTNDFQFTKPALPVRKYAKEKLLAKSAGPLLDTIEQASVIPPVNIQKIQPEIPVEQETDKIDEDDSANITQNTTDLSMRPSFIKRKLFTQKLDVPEKKNTSTYSSNSPPNSIYDDIRKEKNKARKLQQVTTQSCLSRDVLQDDSNLIDLIHKIVPKEQMNVTNQTNKTVLSNVKNKTKDNDEKWDVSSIITDRNEDNISETYTDEEIFNDTIKALQKENVLNKPSAPKLKNCNILIERVPPNTNLVQKQKPNVKEDVGSKNLQKCTQFWDTDLESDAECQPPHRNGDLSYKENHRKDISQQPEALKLQRTLTMFNSKKPTASSTANVSTFLNHTEESINKFNNTSISIRSHRIPKRKKNDLRGDEDAKSDILEPQNKKQKTFQASSCVETTKLEPKKKTELQNNKCTETVTKQLSKQGNKKSPKDKKQAPIADKPSQSMESIDCVDIDHQLTPKKQTVNKKTGQNKPKPNNNQKETILNERGTKNSKQGNKKSPKDKKQAPIADKPSQSMESIDCVDIDNQLTPKKQTVNKKTGQNKPKPNNNQKETILNERGTKNSKQGNKKSPKDKKQAPIADKPSQSMESIDCIDIDNQLTPKKQTVNKKTGQNKPKPNNNQKETILNELGTKNSKQGNKKSPKDKKQAPIADKPSQSMESIDCVDIDNQLTPKKQTVNNKTGQNKPKPNNNQKETILNERGTKNSKQGSKKSPKDNIQASTTDEPNEIIKNKLIESDKKLTPKDQTKNNKTGQKSNNKKETVINEHENKQGSFNDKEKKTSQNTKKELNKKPVQSKQKSNIQNGDVIENEQQIKKLLNNRNKDELTQDDTKSKNQTNKKSAKSENKDKIPKTMNTRNTPLINNISVNEDENNNSHSRTLRLCRISKRNETLDQSNLNDTRTLRSRQINLSSASNEKDITQESNNSKLVRSCRSFKINMSLDQSNSNRSISLRSRLYLPSTSKANQKVSNTKNTNMSRPKLSKILSSDTETSDVSFSISSKKNISSKSRANSKAGKMQKKEMKSTPLKINALDAKQSKINRIKIPNRRYL